MTGMFSVDEPTAAAIRRAFDDGGELAGVIELRRHFPLLADNAHARLCVRTIAGWKPIADQSRNTDEHDRPRDGKACARRWVVFEDIRHGAENGSGTRVSAAKRHGSDV